jgi:tRNA A-37 threonylcarbamoyl transferase component Bud32
MAKAVASSRQSPLDGVLWFMDAILDTVEAAAELAAQSAPPNVVATVRFALAASADFVPGAGTTVNVAEFLIEVYRNYRKKVGSPVSQVFRRQMEALADFGDRSSELVQEFDRRFAKLPRDKVTCHVADVREYIASAPLFVRSRTQQATADVERSGRHARVFSAEKLNEFLPTDLFRLKRGTAVLGPTGLAILVVKPIAVGGFGEVWECEVSGLEGYSGGRLALKYGRTDSHRPVMVRDAQILRRLSDDRRTSACVPRLVFDGTREEVPWILMELVESVRTLRQWTANLVDDASDAEDSGSPVSAADNGSPARKRPILTLLEMAHRVAVVLNTVHAGEVAHGDIKPDNTLVGGNGQVRFVDFGSARHHVQQQQSLSLADMRFVTRAYRPQRALDSESITPRLDLYAFGVVLYEMLLGDTDLAGNAARLRRARVPGDIIGLIDDIIDIDQKRDLDVAAVLARLERTTTWRMRQFNLRVEALKAASRAVVEAVSDKYHGRTAHLSIGREFVWTLASNLAPLLVLALVGTGFVSFVVHVEGRKTDHAIEAECGRGDLDACRVAATCRRTGDCSLSVDAHSAERFEARIAFDRCEQGVLAGCRVVIGCHTSGACVHQHNAPPLEYAKILACRAGAEEFCEAKDPAIAPDAGALATSPTPSQAVGVTAAASAGPAPAIPAGDAIRQPTTAPAASPSPAARPDVATVSTEKRKLPSAAGERQKRSDPSAVQFEQHHPCVADANDVSNWRSFGAICAKLHNATGDHMIDVRVSVPTRVDGEPVVSVWGEDGVGGEAVDCLKSRILASGHALKLDPGCLVKVKVPMRAD